MQICTRFWDLKYWKENFSLFFSLKKNKNKKLFYIYTMYRDTIIDSCSTREKAQTLN